jgi:GH24 family phage-related lysozyme (muramidase)
MKQGAKAAVKPAIKAAKIGGAMGALTGSGASKADLTEGDVGGFAKDVTIGGISGAGLGAATPVLAKVGGKVAGKAAKGAKEVAELIPGAEAIKLGFKAGTKGIKLSEEGFREAIKDYSEKLHKNIVKKMTKEGLDKKAAIELADEIGVRINAGQPVQEVMDEMVEKGAMGLKDAKEKAAFYNVLDDLVNGNDQTIKAIKKLEAKTAKQVAADKYKFGATAETQKATEDAIEDLTPLPEVDGDILGLHTKMKIPAKEGDEALEYMISNFQEILDSPIKLQEIDLTSLKPSQAEELIQYINSFAGDLTKPAKNITEQNARRVASMVRDESNKVLEGVGGKNANIANLFRALRKTGIKDKLRGSEEAMKDQIDAIRKKIAATGESAEIDKERMFEYLEKAGPEFSESIGEGKFLNQLSKLSGMTEDARTTNIRGLLGTAEGAVAKIANVTGRGTRPVKPFTDATKNIANKVTNYPEDKLKVASKWLNSKENKALNAMGQQLEYALQQQDGTIRNALIWSLSQQPAFRREVDKAIESQESQYMQDLGIQQSDSTEPPSSDIPFALPPEMEEEEGNVSRSPATVDDIDQEFILGQEGFETDGYVPVEGKGSNYTAISGSGKIAGNSGVTIASGLDLGQRDNLDDLNLPEDIKEKLIPYLGLKKEDAVNKLREMPLTLTEEEALLVKEATESSYYNLAESKFNKNKYGKEFTDLPPSVQTALYSLVYNTGTIGPNTLDKASNDNDYSDLLEELRNYYKEGSEADTGFQGQRRRLEADYIEQNLIEDIQKQKDRESKQLGSGAQAGTERSSLDDLMRSLNDLRNGQNEKMVAEMEDSAMAGDMNNLQELIDRLRAV